MELIDNGNAVALSLTGKLGLSDVAQIHALCIDAVNSGRQVQVQLSEAAHLHAAVVQCLRALELRLQATGSKLVIGPISKPAADALRWSGLGHWLPLEPGA